MVGTSVSTMLDAELPPPSVTTDRRCRSCVPGGGERGRLGRWTAKTVAAAAVVTVRELSCGAVLAPLPSVVDAGELDQLELAEELRDRAWVVDAMCVEHQSLPTDRQREQQLAAGAEHALQLGGRAARAVRVERVAIAPEPDVFGDVEAGHRLQRAICIGQ